MKVCARCGGEITDEEMPRLMVGDVLAAAGVMASASGTHALMRPLCARCMSWFEMFMRGAKMQGEA